MVNPVIQMLRPISPIAWIPVAIVLFGVGDLAAMLSDLPRRLLPDRRLDDERRAQCSVDVSGAPDETSDCRRLRFWRGSCFPAALPQMLVGLRIALGIAWLVVVAAEMIAVDSGLGYLVIDARNAGKRYDLVVAAMMLIGLTGLALDLGIRRAEKLKSVRWGFRNAVLARRVLLGASGWAGARLGASRLPERQLVVGRQRLPAGRQTQVQRRLHPGDVPPGLPGDRLHLEILGGRRIFLPRMFQGFPEIKEALISNKMQAAFIVAPLAIALKAQGVPIKIVYLGHRYGSAVVVQKDGPVHTVAGSARTGHRDSEPVLRRTADSCSAR